MKKVLRNLRFSTRRLIFGLYAKIKYLLPVWRFFNRKSIKCFQENKPRLDNVQERILQELNDTGMAISSLSELYTEKPERLTELITFLEKKKDRMKINHKKKFLIDYLPEIPDLGFENPFFKLAIDPKILDIINSYMGMCSMLTYFMVQKTADSSGQKPYSDQMWHRGQQERRMCKVFIYLNDIESEKDGPFYYVINSTRDREFGKLFPPQIPKGTTIENEDLGKKIPKQMQKVILGKAGTVIFADTTGINKGAYAYDGGYRVMSTFGYGAPTYRENIHYSFPAKLVYDDISHYPIQSRTLLNPKWVRKTH